MRKWYLLLAMLLGLSLGVGPALSLSSTERPDSEHLTINPSGAGETLIVVSMGVYDMEEEARAAASEASFGHLQGFYIDRTEHYEVVGTYQRRHPPRRLIDCSAPSSRHAEAGCEQAGGAQQIWIIEPARLALSSAGGKDLSRDGSIVLTAFRTKRGAENFLDMATTFGIEDLEVLRVRKSGSSYVGLGQEAHPAGHGPLTAPLDDQGKYQR